MEAYLDALHHHERMGKRVPRHTKRGLTFKVE